MVAHHYIVFVYITMATDNNHTHLAVEIFHQYWWIFVVLNKPLILVEIIHHPSMAVYSHHAWWFIATKCDGNARVMCHGLSFHMHDAPADTFDSSLKMANIYMHELRIAHGTDAWSLP